MAEVRFTIAADVNEYLRAGAQIVQVNRNVETALQRQVVAVNAVQSTLTNTAKSGALAFEQAATRIRNVRLRPQIAADLRDSLRAFEASRRLRQDREVRYIEPARVRGLDTSDEAVVREARQARAAELRALRAERRHAEARERTAAAVSSARARLSQIEQQSVAEQQRHLVDFRSRMTRMRAQETAAAEARSKLAGQARMVGAAALAGAYFAGQALEQYRTQLGSIAGEGATMERELRPLLSLGANAANARGLRSQVIDLSTATGIARPEVAQAMFNLQSGTANLDAPTRKQLLRGGMQMTQVAGGNLDTNLTALVKAWQVYGDQVQSVDLLQGKLFTTMEQGFMTMEDLARLLPDVMPAGKAFGLSLDEIGGSLITATQVGGRNEKTFTGMRNLVTRMSNAKDEGIDLGTGDFVSKIERLAKVDPEIIKKIFGDEAITTVLTLTQNVEQLRKNIEAVGRVQPGLLQGKQTQQLGDPTTRAGQFMGMMEQYIANIPATKFQDPAMQADLVRYKVAEAAYERFTPESARAVTPQALREGVMQFYADPSRPEFQAIVSDLVAQASKSGNTTMAESLKVQFGTQFGLKVGQDRQVEMGSDDWLAAGITGRESDQYQARYLGDSPGDVQDYLSAREKEPGLTSGEYARRRMAGEINAASTDLRAASAELRGVAGELNDAARRRLRNPGSN